MIENINEYVKKLSDAFLYHTLPKEEPIQVRSETLYFTLSKDYPEGRRDVTCIVVMEALVYLTAWGTYIC